MDLKQKVGMGVENTSKKSNKKLIDFIVRHELGDYDNIFIVKARSSKEAINYVFDNHFVPLNNYIIEHGNNFMHYKKKHFSAISLEREYETSSCGIINVH